MSRRNTNSKPWNSRLSAGGANKTNIQGQTRRGDIQELMTTTRQDSHFDLMPRLSNFRPLNSRFNAPRRRLSPEQYSHWEPPPPPTQFPTRRPSLRTEYCPPPVTRRERSPDVLLDHKGRPIPKKGMFLNAKYSEAVQPDINEAQIRRTEEMIRRIAGPQRQNEFDYQNNYRSNELRDRIRQVVYDMGVPDEYRAHAPSPFEQCPPSRRLSSDPYHSIGRKSRDGYRRSESVFEDGDDERHTLKKRRKSNEQEYFDESRPGTSTSVRTQRVDSRNSKNKSIGMKKKEKQKHAESEESSDDEEAAVLQKSLNSSGRSVASKTKEDRANTSRNSKNSSIVLPPSPGYSKDPDDDDNWRNSLPYMSKADGGGAAMFSRIGSAIPALPLKDNTKNNYSKVAMMLLSKSINEMCAPRQDQEPRETLQTQLMNMTTSWARTPASEDSPDVFEATKTPRLTLINEISKIQHPQNATKSDLQMDESLFRNSRFFEEVAGERVKTKERITIPPPLYQSSPKSNDVFRSDEGGFTMPSSIRKTQNSFPIQNEFFDDEEEEPPSQYNAMDDYIARGASQLTFSKSPEMHSSESKSSQHFQYNTTVANTSRRSKNSSEIIGETPRQKSSNREKTGEESISAEKTSIHLNSCFEFNAKRPKSSSRKNAMLDFDEETQKMFEDAFGHGESGGEQVLETSSQRNREKFSFGL